MNAIYCANMLLIANLVKLTVHYEHVWDRQVYARANHCYLQVTDQ